MASLLTLTFSQPTKALSPGEILVHEGDPGGDIYVLESGRLTVERDGVVIATIADPGALIGEMSVLLGKPNTATVRAKDKASVRVVRDAIAFLERQPLVTLRVATLLSERLDATSALLVELKKEHGGKDDTSFFNRLMTALLTHPTNAG
jgi:CRP-like cAMP-binding protein